MMIKPPRRNRETGFATIYLIAGIGVLLILLALAGKYILHLNGKSAVQEREIAALADSVNAAAKIADMQAEVSAHLNAELLKNQTEKSAIQRRLWKVTSDLRTLEVNNDEVKDWKTRCDPIPHALFVCLQTGDCGTGVAGSNP